MAEVAPAMVACLPPLVAVGGVPVTVAFSSRGCPGGYPRCGGRDGGGGGHGRRRDHGDGEGLELVATKRLPGIVEGGPVVHQHGKAELAVGAIGGEPPLVSENPVVLGGVGIVVVIAHDRDHVRTPGGIAPGPSLEGIDPERGFGIVVPEIEKSACVIEIGKKANSYGSPWLRAALMAEIICVWFRVVLSICAGVIWEIA